MHLLVPVDLGLVKSCVPKLPHSSRVRTQYEAICCSGLAIWRERRLVWTLGGVGNHFYYVVEGLQSTEIRTKTLTFACVLHQIALFRLWIDVWH